MSTARDRWQAPGKPTPTQPSPPKPIPDNAAPTWGQGDRTNWDKENVKMVNELRAAPKDLQRDWGRGGSQGTKGVKQFDKAFRLLTERLIDLFFQDKLYKESKEVALATCAAILAMEEVPHWDDGHLQDIRNIRENLEPTGYWNDWPENGEEDDDDDDMP